MEILKTIPLDQIDPSPYRDLKKFPLREEAVASLVDKMSKNGVLPGTGGACARPHGDRYQLAYGHHRLEALRRVGATTANVLVDDLDEDQMVVYLAMENDDLRNSGFLAQYESWLAAKSLILNESGEADSLTARDVARKLGWTRTGTIRGEQVDMVNQKAEICSGFEKLEHAGVARVDQIRDWTLKQTETFVTEQRAAQMAAKKRAEQLRKLDRADDAEREVARVQEAGRRMVDKVNSDEVHTAAELKKEMRQERQRLEQDSQLGDSVKIQKRQELDSERAEAQRRKLQNMPDVGDIVSQLKASMSKMLPEPGAKNDGIAEIIQVMDLVIEAGHLSKVEDLIGALRALSERAEGHARRLDAAIKMPVTSAKVVNLIEQKG